jgi:hypothetical protein
MTFLRTLFSQTGMLIIVYLFIGIFANTAAPHVPGSPVSVAGLHSWIQYLVSVVFWPLSFWHPVFSVGKWAGH